MNTPSGQPDPVTRGRGEILQCFAGMAWVNCDEEGDMNVPFGGVKLSGSGRDKSRHAMDEYTDLKTTWINYG